MAELNPSPLAGVTPVDDTQALTSPVTGVVPPSPPTPSSFVLNPQEATVTPQGFQVSGVSGFAIPPYETPPADFQISGVPLQTVTPEHAQFRARYYHQIMGETSPGIDAIYNRIINGQEDLFRGEVAAAQRSTLLAERSEFARQYIQVRGASSLTSEDAAFIRNLASGRQAEEQTDPISFMERLSAQRAMAMVRSRGETLPRDVSEAVTMASESHQMLAQYAQRKLHDLVQRSDERSPQWGNTWDFLGTLVSPVQWWRRMNILPRMQQDAPLPGFFSGSNTDEQAAWYYAQLDNPDVAIKALDRALEYLTTGFDPRGEWSPQQGGGNLLNAIQFLQDLVDVGPYNRSVGNLFSALDVAPGIGFVPYGVFRLTRPRRISIPGGGLRTGAEAAEQATQQATKETIEAVEELSTAQRQVSDAVLVNHGRPDADAAVHEAAGDFTMAADFTARQQLLRTASVTHGDAALDDWSGYARSIMDPYRVVSEGGPRLSNEAAQRRMYEQLSQQAEEVTKALITRPTEINRLEQGSQALRAAAEETYRIGRFHQYDYVHDRVLDVRLVQPHSNIHLPPKLAKLANNAQGLESQVRRARLVAGYREFETDMNAAALLKKTMESHKSKAVKAVNQNNPSKALREAMAKAGQQELLDKNKEIMGRLAATPQADRDLFMKTYRARQAYQRATTLERIEGFGDRLGIDVPTIRGLAGVHYVEIPIGTKDAKLFQSARSARVSAMHELGLRPDTYEIMQQGNGWYIRVLKPVDETTENVRDKLSLDLASDRTPVPTLGAWWIQAIKGGTTKVSKGVDTDLKVAVYGSNAMYDSLAKIVRSTMLTPFRWKYKNEGKEFVGFIEHQRLLYDNVTKVRGTFSKNQFELEEAWLKKYDHLPTERQSLAYWTYRQIHDMDKLLRDMSIYRDKARAGLENHHFTYTGANEILELEGKVIANLDIRAARQAGAGFLVWDKNLDNLRHIYINNLGSMDDIKYLQDQGYKMLQITHYAMERLYESAPVKEQLQRIARNRNGVGVDFILTKEFRSSPLPFQQTPNLGGGHHQYDFGWLIRQPKIRGNKYTGDITLRGFERHRRTDAQYFIHHYEEARRLLKEETDSGNRIAASHLDDYVRTHLPDDPAEFRKLFDNQYDVNVPFVMTESGKSAWVTSKLEMNYPGIKNVADSPLNLYNTSTLKFMLERGDTPLTIARSGTKENPTWALKPAPMVSALPTMDRAVQHIINNKNFSDVQIKMAERFITEFDDVLDAPRRVLAEDPLKHLISPTFRSDADANVVAAAKNFSIVAQENLRNLATPETSWYRTQIQKLLDNVYQLGGERAGHWLANSSLIKRISNPVDAIRSSTAYYFLTAPAQFLIQSAGVLNIAAHTSYDTAIQALPAAIYGRIIRDYTGVSNMMEHVFPKLKEWGWSREHFMEAYQAGKDSGFFNISRQHSLNDDLAQMRTIKRGATGSIGDIAMLPFRKGNELVHHAAFWAAYKTWRDANPTAILDDTVKAQLLRDADRMAGNQTTVGMSSLQRGITGIPTSMWGYNMRLWEQLMGLDQHNLTKAQKAKMFAHMFLVNSVFYGVPATVGLATFYPVADTVKVWMISQGSQVEDKDRNFFAQLAMDMDKNGGLSRVALDLFMNGITQYLAPGTNISSRIAPGGNRFFADLIGDKTAIEIMTGAGGSAVRDMMLAVYPFWASTMEAFTPVDERTGVTIKTEDWQRLIMNLGGRGVSQVMRSYWALTLGELMSQQRIQLDEVTTAEALILALTGLTPSRVDTAFEILRSEDGLRKLQSFHSRYIVQAHRDMLKAASENRYDDVLDYQKLITQHMTLGRYRPDQRTALISRILRDEGSTVENIYRRFSRQSPEAAEFYNAYRRRQEGNE